MSERTIGENYIEDKEKARAGADAQKPARDLAREEGVTEEEKIVLDGLAERRGEKAEQKYEEEKEQNPVERLLKNIDKIAARMREKGLEKDALIVGKVMSRFVNYVDGLRREKAIFKEENNEVAKFIDIEDSVARSIPITYKGPKKDGAVYNTDGRRMDTVLKKHEIKILRELHSQGKGDYEIINFCFSDQGKTDFLGDIGVLEDIEGVTVRVERDVKSSGEIISLQFDERFLEKLVASL